MRQHQAGKQRKLPDLYKCISRSYSNRNNSHRSYAKWPTGGWVPKSCAFDPSTCLLCTHAPMQCEESRSPIQGKVFLCSHNTLRRHDRTISKRFSSTLQLQFSISCSKLREIAYAKRTQTSATRQYRNLELVWPYTLPIHHPRILAKRL